MDLKMQIGLMMYVVVLMSTYTGLNIIYVKMRLKEIKLTPVNFYHEFMDDFKTYKYQKFTGHAFILGLVLGVFGIPIILINNLS